MGALYKLSLINQDHVGCGGIYLIVLNIYIYKIVDQQMVLSILCIYWFYISYVFHRITQFNYITDKALDFEKHFLELYQC